MNALDNIRILDLTEKLTGCLATMYLCSFGAEVVKIELPRGDRTRRWSPVREEGSVYFNYLNSGKKSAVIDYTSEEGQKILYKLLGGFDVICLDKTTKEAQALGLDYETVKEIAPAIIYAACTYFGQSGPFEEKAASSLTVQAKGVAMDMTGEPGMEPVRLAPSVPEHYSAAYMATGVVMALIDRETRGIGQKVDIALLDSIFSCIEAAPAAYSSIGEIQRRKGNDDPTCAPYDTIPTNDGYVTLGVATQQQWINFCKAMGFEDLLENPDYFDYAKRLAGYRENLKPELERRLAGISKKEVEKRARAVGVPCGAVQTIDEITEMENSRLNHYITEVESERFGKLIYPDIPFTLSETPARKFSDAPELGSSTDEIMKEAMEGGRQQ